MRDDEPRPVWTSLSITHCVCLLLQDLTCCLLLQYLIQSCAHGGRRIVENKCGARSKRSVRVNPIPNPDPNPNQAPQMSLKEA
jgi:hypothetical protein